MIKFRVWSKDLSKYRKLDDISNDQGLGMLFEVQKGIGSNVTSICYSINDVVEQFTGLKDVNGKDIYVGDILKLSYDEPESYIYKDEFDCNPRVIPPKTVNDTVQVVNNTGAFGVTHHGTLFTTLRDVDKGRQSIEIIGNIHENPELLEESK
ncbi:YopX family protein [Companilactobacillus alimentarius]|uniref:YopX family protein n=1 Tax=Companilactobacillus alimentarius TaxID=1602 RepID=UPI0028B7AE57|nr:YopX family protein [Companilactobacillus alimentarius]MDT6951851.1 YopX family protein [Companilactobacillus alimentarius]